MEIISNSPLANVATINDLIRTIGDNSKN